MKKIIALLIVSSSLVFAQTSPTKSAVEVRSQTPDQWDAKVKDLEKQAAAIDTQLMVDPIYTQSVQIKNDLATARAQRDSAHQIKDEADREVKRKAAVVRSAEIRKAKGLPQ